MVGFHSATIRINSMNNFQKLTTTKKGNLGEYIVDKYLLDKNIIPYIPHQEIMNI